MERKTFALYTLIAGAVVGVAADLLFYGKLIGVSFPLFMLIGIAVVLISDGLLHKNRPLNWRNLWVLIPALFFAAMVAVRAEPGSAALNVMASLALSALALHYLPLSERIDLETVWDHGVGVVETGVSVLFAPIFELFDAGALLLERMRGDFHTVIAVGRGLVIAVPVLLIFALLFASADAVFAGYVERVWAIFNVPDEALVMQVLLIGGIGWVASGTLAYGVARRSTAPVDDDAKPKAKLPSLGMIEASIVLGTVDLLFALFVIIQFAYFFGGRATLAVNDLTYSEYARHGFFELVAVSVLTLGLVNALDWVTVRHALRHTRIFRIFAVILVALTGVILVSAAQRMSLYEDQFGFTALRVQTHVFMVWLAVLFGCFLLALFRVRERIFSLGVLIVLIGYVGTLDLINVEGYIAEHNVARVAEGYELDFAYLNSFSVDAAPVMIDLFQTAQSPTLRKQAGQWLRRKQMELDYQRETNGSTIFSANLARDTTWAALHDLDDQLPVYDPSYDVRPSAYSSYN